MVCHYAKGISAAEYQWCRLTFKYCWGKNKKLSVKHLKISLVEIKGKNYKLRIKEIPCSFHSNIKYEKKLKKYTQLYLLFFNSWLKIRSNLKCSLYEQLSFIYRLKLYPLFINGKNETTLYRQWFVIQRYPLRQVWL